MRSPSLVHPPGRPRVLSNADIQYIVAGLNQEPAMRIARMARDLGRPDQTVADEVHRRIAPLTSDEFSRAVELSTSLGDEDIASVLIRPISIVRDTEAA
ncbi:MAG: hypothetical protein ABL962_17185 [Fimbriimonadaceae bacterium]